MIITRREILSALCGVFSVFCGYSAFIRYENFSILLTISILILSFLIGYFITYFVILPIVQKIREAIQFIFYFLIYLIHSKFLISYPAKYYSIAEDEINNQTMDKNLWSLALVKAKGDGKLRKAEYIKLRVKQLYDRQL